MKFDLEVTAGWLTAHFSRCHAGNYSFGIRPACLEDLEYDN